MTSDEIEVVIESTTAVADDVRLLTFARADGGALPPWPPGAHIDVLLDDGLVRQYSLCGDPMRGDSWQIAVLREPESRGGSVHLHGSTAPGDRLRVRGVRDTFSFGPATEYVFIAGGIGITPLLPMILAAHEAGRPWRLHYAARSRRAMVFADMLTDRFGDRVVLYPSDEDRRLELDELIGAAPPAAEIYCCGPERLIVDIERRTTGRRPGSVHVERFHPRALDDAAENTAFVVELAQSGLELDVAADSSILEVVREAGVDVESSCEEGTCGTCETEVIEGDPDHRDSVLSDFERECGETMMICVSRSCGGKLVLDL